MTPEQTGLFANAPNSTFIRRVTDLIPLGGSLSGESYDLSPDGEALVFLSQNEQGQGIFVVSTRNGVATLLRKANLSETTIPRWSPDGQQIAFGELEGLYVISRKGGEPKKLAHIYRWVSVDWSPDGKRLGGIGYTSREHFQDKDHQSNALFVYSFEDETFRRVTPREEDYQEGAVWHPDSRRVTYMYYASLGGAQLRFAYVNGRPTTLMFDQEDHWDYVGRWAPDGKRFYFTTYANAHTPKNIDLFHLDTGEIEHALWDGTSLPTWSRDGKMMTWATEKTVREFVFLENIR